MELLNSISEVQKFSREKKREGFQIVFVPTMGALHQGHLSLIEKAKTISPIVISSIFVNPLQFGPKEDLAKYPRTLEADSKLLKDTGVSALFAPQPESFYPPDFQSLIQIKKLSQHLCGQSRPGHFEGVATVCTKLFSSTLADFAIFGEKDFQQVRILEQMVKDLSLPLVIVRAPIVREPDGLAMSSRNRFLSHSEREDAAFLFKALTLAKNLAPRATVQEIRNEIEKLWANTAIQTDYISIAEEEDLIPLSEDAQISTLKAPRLFLAAKLGTTRLIDNGGLK